MVHAVTFDPPIPESMYRAMWDGFAEPFAGLIRAFRERVLSVMQRVFPAAGIPSGSPQFTELDVIDVRQGTGRA